MGNTNTTMTATLKILADVSSAQGSVSKLASAFSKIKFSDSLKADFTAAIQKFEKQADDFKEKLSQPIETKGQANSLNKGAQELKKSYNEILKYVKSAQKELTAEGVDVSQIFKIDSSTQNQIKELEQKIKEIKQTFADFLGGTNFASVSESGITALNDSLDETDAKVLTFTKALDNAKSSVTKLGGDKGFANLDASASKVLEKVTNLKDLLDKVSTNSNKKDRLDIIEALNSGDLETASAKLEQLYNNYQRLSKSQGDNATWQQNILAIGTTLEVVNSLLQIMDGKVSGLETDKFDLMKASLEKVAKSFDEAVTGAKNTQGAVGETAEKTKELTQAQLEYVQSMEQMKNRIAYFFGINNAVQLFQKLLRSAINSVKELDAAMTETATVTDFSIGDMWDQLPRYTAAANELGTTTLGAYETMTLFYQQGLDTNEVFQIGTETMKMARIAGLEYEDATNKMTAALRGFNMELNDTSAQRVNDVYSELAAITAADTNEIATAMTKTASIAKSANMEFETTSAFLSQIIETTRESAETAGTAMKTIIARFQELKKDPASIQPIDGESIDANKIETALRSVGIALRDTEGQFRDLDDVFLDLAQRWSSLDTNTQRYIATMAAGSRQQSRFIAMMQDYDRTMELVDAAYDSNGSSQKQFEKTLDSLETKLNELKNAWNEFAMGVANSDLIKWFVTALTDVIEFVNNLTNSESRFVSFAAKVTLLIGTFKLLKATSNAVFAGLNADISEGVTFWQAFGQGFAKTFNDGLFAKIKKHFSETGKTAEASAAEAATATSTAATEASASVEANAEKAEAPVKETCATVTTDVKATGASIVTDATATADAVIAQVNKVKAAINGAPTTGNTGASAIIKSATKNVDGAGMGQTKSGLFLLPETMQKAGVDAVGDEIGDVVEGITEMSDAVDDAAAAGKVLEVVEEGVAGKAGQAAGEGVKAASGFSKWAQSSGGLAAVLGVTNIQLALIEVAIAVVVAGAWLLANAIETNKEKQERLNKVIDQSNDAYKNLTDDIKTLNDSMEELGSLESELDGLIKGTEAWDNKLAEVNETVSSIISDFPELAKYLEVDTNGKFGLSEKGVSEYISGLEKAQNNALLMELSAQKELAGVNKDVAYQDFINSIIKSTGISDYGIDESGNTQFFSESDTDSIVAYMQELADQGQISAEQMGEVNTAYAEYINELNRLTSEEKAIIDSFIKAAMANNADYDNLKYKDATSDLASRKLEGNYTNSDEWKGKTVGKLQEELRGLGVSDIEIDQALEGASGWKERRAALRSLLATKTNEGAADEYIEEIAEAFSRIKDPDVANKIASIFANEGAGISYETLKSYLPGLNAGETSMNLEDLLKGTGYNSIEEMAGAFGFETVDEFGDMVFTNLNNARKEYQKKYANLAKSYGKATQVGTGKIVTNIEEGSEDLTKGYEGIVERVQTLQDKYSAQGLDFVDVAESIDTSLQASGNGQLTNLGNQAFLEISEDTKTSSQDLQDIQSFVNSFDWSNPIDGAAAFKEELTRGSGASKEFAEQLQGVAEETFSASAQMQYFIKSSDFEGVQEDLDDILKEQEEISAQDVKSLASSYKSLDKMLDNGVTTAEGLARALTLISEGSLSFTDLTDNVMTAMGSMSSLEQMSAETLDTLSNFDPGIDENEVGDFLNTAYETLNENLSKGAVGNSQNFEYLDFLFGENWRAGINETADNYGDLLVARMKGITEILGENTEDMSNFWTNLAEGKNFGGYELGTEGVGNAEALDKAGLRVQKTDDGGVELLGTGEDGKITATTDEVVAALAEAYGTTEDFARMMLTDFSNYSADLAWELKGNDFASGIQKVYDNLKNTSEYKDGKTLGFFNSKQIDKSEIETIAQLYGKTYDEVVAELTKDGRKITITDFYDEDGILKSGAALTAEIAKTSVEGYAEATQSLAELEAQEADLQAQIDEARSNGQTEQANQLVAQLNGVQIKIRDTKAELEELESQTYDQFYTQSGDTAKVDLDKIYEQGAASGLSGATLDEYVNNTVQNIQNALNGTPLELKFTSEDGTTLTTGLLEGQTAAQAQSLAQAEADAKLVGDAVGEAIESRLSEIKITYDYDPDKAALTWGQFHDEQQTLADADPVKVPVEYKTAAEEGATVDASDVSTSGTASVPTTAEPVEGTGEDASAEIQEQLNNAETPSTEIQATVGFNEESSSILQTATQGALDEASPYDVLVKMSENSTLASEIDAAIPDSETIYVKADLTSAYNSLNVFKQQARQAITATTHAKGIHDSSTSHTALIGEAGPEIHQTATGWYLAETPQLAQIEKGDTVYNASETKNILNGGEKTKLRPRYASAYRSKWGYTGNASKSSSTGSTSGTTSATSAAADAEEAAEIWENTFDWLYNLTEDINEILRDREKIERQYDKILAKRNTTAKDLWENVQEQLAVLEVERQKQQEMYDKRKWEMEDYLSKNSGLAQYATYNWDDMTIEIDWDKIDAVTDEDMGEAIEDYVSKLEDIQDEMDDAEDELMEIEDRIEELADLGKDEYLDFENLVFEALQAQKQALIDNASEISEAIADTNSNLLSALSDSISQMREDRELEEDRTSLEDQQKKLIYLQQDTSGGNALEILKLQQDIEDAQQSYTDKLIDRKIDELQQQNDEAKEQRERQIELAQEQLDHWSDSEAKWDDIYAVMATGIDGHGALITGSDLDNALKNKDNFKGLSETGQMNWLKEIQEMMSQGLSWFAEDHQLEKIGKTSGTVDFTDAAGNKYTDAAVSSDGSITVRGTKDGKTGTYTYNGVYQNYDGTYRTMEDLSTAVFTADKPKEEEKKNTGSSNNNNAVDDDWDGRRVKKTGWTGVYMYDSETYYAYDYIKWNGQKSYAEDGYVWVGYSRSNITGKVPKSGLTRYKTGGIADYTGPAWLDGTPSKPEIVLNAQDTKNFIELKNVLASLMSNGHSADPSTNSMGNGDNYYDIDISVESISSDYDVEKMADKVKGMIVQDGLYRNVNSINRLK